MRPLESFSTWFIQALCMFSHTLDVGAMKVWNFSVTDCWARPERPGAPRAAATPDWRRVLRWIMTGVPCWKEGDVSRKNRLDPPLLPGVPLSRESHQPQRDARERQDQGDADEVADQE